LLSQKWAERKRRLLVVAPANLRKQWSVELSEKFHLPSVILEAKSFNASVKSGNLNPFEQQGIVLCSYQFVRSKEPYVSRTEWDLVVIDEAHRLRNVYKTSSKIGKVAGEAIRTALVDQKMLDSEGRIGSAFDPKNPGFALTMPAGFDDLKAAVIDVLAATIRIGPS
jgi:hypothetical protein